MELPSYNRKKVIDIWLTGLVAKNDPFSIFWKVISRKPLYLHRRKFSQNSFLALSVSVPNFIEIRGVTRTFSKKVGWSDTEWPMCFATQVTFCTEYLLWYTSQWTATIAVTRWHAFSTHQQIVAGQVWTIATGYYKRYCCDGLPSVQWTKKLCVTIIDNQCAAL